MLMWIAVSFGFGLFLGMLFLASVVVTGRGKGAGDGQRHFWSSIWGFVVFALAVVVLWASTFWVMPFLFGTSDGALSAPSLAGVGEAGDMFGSVTALFSGLAFAGLISTLLMQRQELELQRGELRATREEFALQRFEKRVFQLIDLFNDHVGSLELEEELDFPSKPEKRLGRDVLRHYAKKLPDEYYVEYQPVSSGGYEAVFYRSQNPAQAEDYVALYETELEGDLGPYFRLLYHAVRAIETAQGISETERASYAKIVRSYLSSAEVKLLMFNCNSGLGKDFRPWVIKYGLLKHLHPDDAANNVSLVKSYPSAAFAGRFTDLEHRLPLRGRGGSGT